MKTFLLSAGIIGVGVLITMALLLSRPEPERQVPAKPGVPVRLKTVESRDERLVVEAAGTVLASQSVIVQPQVAGRLIWVNPGLVPGGLVERGEHLVTIEPEDYRLALAARQSDLVEARSNLLLEMGRQDVALQEWDRYISERPARVGQPDPEAFRLDRSLATRKPQMQSAEARVKRAETLVERAGLDLQRTRIEAPFSAVITEENAAVGQLVNSQSRIAVLISTEDFWVEAALPVEFIPHIEIPGISGPTGSEASVFYEFSRKRLALPGRVFRLLPEIDPAGRMGRLLIRVKDPYGLAQQSGEAEADRGLPLLVGSYVDVAIQGPVRRELIEIPRTALHNGTEVFVMDREQILDIREVEIVWERRDTVLVGRGLVAGDRLVISRIAAPLEGMALRPLNGESATDAGSGNE